MTLYYFSFFTTWYYTFSICKDTAKMSKNMILFCLFSVLFCDFLTFCLQNVIKRQTITKE